MNQVRKFMPQCPNFFEKNVMLLIGMAKIAFEAKIIIFKFDHSGNLRRSEPYMNVEKHEDLFMQRCI